MPDQNAMTPHPVVTDHADEAVTLDPQAIGQATLIGGQPSLSPTLGLHTTATRDHGAGFNAHGDASLGVASLGKTGLGLAVVIALIFVCSALLKRFGPYKRIAGRSLRVVSSQAVGQRERVVVVEIEDTWLVLGVAPGRVNTLHTLPARHDSAGADAQGDTVEASRPSTPPSFGEAFSDNLRRALSRLSRNDRDH